MLDLVLFQPLLCWRGAILHNDRVTTEQSSDLPMLMRLWANAVFVKEAPVSSLLVK
jgi:hypothetical protein